MIEPFNRKDKKESCLLLMFLNENFDHDFYVTSDNARIYITDIKSLKLLFQDSIHIFGLKQRGLYVGIITLWKSLGAGTERYYVKICAEDEKIARDLLTVLLWNTNKDLYVKIRNDSKFMSVFKSKGFRFKGGRGLQILLNRKPKLSKPNFINNYKEEEESVRYY